MARAKGEHYVNNKEFLQAMIEWRASVEDAENSGKTPPPCYKLYRGMFFEDCNSPII